MMRANHKMMLIILVSLSACAASLSQDRRDYILAHPHGWVELTINDYDIPYLPPTTEKPDEPIFPEYCYVSVELDNERYLSDSAYPFGKTEPFSVETGFRFPAPIGVADVLLTYSGCDVVDGEESEVEIGTTIEVIEQHITEIEFKGNELALYPHRPNDVINLDDIYEAITGTREKR